jgi:hypothetical protein
MTIGILAYCSLHMITDTGANILPHFDQLNDRISIWDLERSKLLMFVFMINFIIKSITVLRSMYACTYF